MRPYQGEYYTRMVPPIPVNQWGMHLQRVVVQHTDLCIANGSRAMLFIAEAHEDIPEGWVIGIIEGEGLLIENAKLKAQVDHLKKTLDEVRLMLRDDTGPQFN